MAALWRGCARSTGSRAARLMASRGMASEVVELDHTSKWMHNQTKKSPMQLISEVPPIEVNKRIVACVGSKDPALGHPIEFICLDLPEPNVCKYCGLRYVQKHNH